MGTETLANEMRITAPLLVVASGLIILVCITSMSRVDKASGEGLAPNVETTAQGETAEFLIFNEIVGYSCDFVYFLNFSDF